eukprot:gnl/MRDRNA2_/MRDRNA2_156833_c0_seq1.p1 gnl/MRDRNA2_/MRDRNA2_156833_c0~~gnl/MRDRNA2_/MRDRNA2_156833_c0_seq1.p1  ORF type:complete len:287 (+),score=31.84 gnl/MRDRNA2_/MRDRNA2_156833_c0_seq1:132-992(+)
MPLRRDGGHIFTEADAGLSLHRHSLAGALAAVFAKAIVYPLDTWKSRLQRSSGSSSGVWALRGIYRGFLLKIMLYSPYQAVYMAAYTRSRDILLEVLPNGHTAGIYMVAGVTAEVTASIIRLPMEVMKVRCQTGVYQSSWQAVGSFISNPGSFYKMLVPQTFLHDCPFSACSWLVFESLRQQLLIGREEAVLSVHENLFIGCAAGGLTAFITTPTDVLKTRIVTRRPGDQENLSIRASARTILRKEGVSAFWKGWALRVAHIAPAQGLYMLVFEGIKQVMFTYDFP